jgi:RNA polymerase sigma factor (sigma-70 family)
MAKYTDKEILAMIKAGGRDRERAIAFLYTRERRKIIDYAKRNSGDEHDGKDLLQESIATFLVHVLTGRFRSESSISTYLYQIAKYRWLNDLRRRKKFKRPTMPQDEEVPSDNEVSEEENYGLKDVFKFMREECHNLLQGIIKQLGEKCETLILLRFFDGLPFKEIMKKMGYENEVSTRHRLYRCLEQLRKEIMGNQALLDCIEEYYDDHGR